MNYVHYETVKFEAHLFKKGEVLSCGTPKEACSKFNNLRTIDEAIEGFQRILDREGLHDSEICYAEDFAIEDAGETVAKRFGDAAPARVEPRHFCVVSRDFITISPACYSAGVSINMDDTHLGYEVDAVGFHETFENWFEEIGKLAESILKTGKQPVENPYESDEPKDGEFSIAGLQNIAESFAVFETYWKVGYLSFGGSWEGDDGCELEAELLGMLEYAPLGPQVIPIDKLGSAYWSNRSRPIKKSRKQTAVACSIRQLSAIYKEST